MDQIKESTHTPQLVMSQMGGQLAQKATEIQYHTRRTPNQTIV
jgi:hypothetical protein